MNAEPGAQLERLLQEAGWLRALARNLVEASCVDDVVQDTWLAALHRRPDPHRPPRPWLARVLRNVASNRRRHERRRLRREADAEVEAAAASPPELALAAELQRRLADAIAKLPASLRDVVVLAYFHGLDSTQLGRRLGISSSAVRTRHQRAIEALRDALDARSPGGRGAWMSATIACLLANDVSLRRSSGAWIWGGGMAVALAAAAWIVDAERRSATATTSGDHTVPVATSPSPPPALLPAAAVPSLRMSGPAAVESTHGPAPAAADATIRGRLLVDGGLPEWNLHLRLLGEAEARALVEPVEPGVARERIRPLRDVVLAVAARGEFRFDGLPATFRGRLFVEGCAPVDGGESVPIEAPGSPVVVLLRAGPRLTGTLRVPAGGPATVGGRCEVCTGRSGQPADRTMVVPFEVGDGGAFTIPVLPTGEWVTATLRVEIDGHCFLHHATDRLAGGRRHPLGVLEASPVRALELLVVDDAGQPLPTATLCVDGAGPACRLVQADEHGVCRMAFLPQRPCVLLVQAPRHAERRIPSPAAASSLVELSPLATLTVQVCGSRAAAVRRIRLSSDTPLLAGQPAAGRRSRGAGAPFVVHVDGDPPVRWQYVFDSPGGVLQCADLLPGVAFVAEALDAADAVLSRVPGVAGATPAVMPLPTH